MAVIAEVTLRGISREQYDAVRAGTGWLERMPDGGLAHLTWWEGEDCHNLDGWESEAAFDAFGEQRLGPAMAALGLDVVPEVTFHPAHEIFTPTAGVVAATETPNIAAMRQCRQRPGWIRGLRCRRHPERAGSVRRRHRVAGAGQHLHRRDVPRSAAEPRTSSPGWRRPTPSCAWSPSGTSTAVNTVLALGRHRGRTTSGNAFDVPWMHLWSFRDGKVVEFTEMFDTAPVAAALGEVADNRSAEAEAILRRMFDEIINEGRLDVADELFAEDYVDHGPMGDLAGRGTFKQLVAQWRDAVPDVHCEVDTVIAQGDLCAWLVRTTGTHTGDGLGFPATGRRFETVSANVGRFRDGQAVEHWSEQGMFPMLAQIGVLPMPAPAVPSQRGATAGAGAAAPAGMP